MSLRGQMRAQRSRSPSPAAAPAVAKNVPVPKAIDDQSKTSASKKKENALAKKKLSTEAKFLKGVEVQKDSVERWNARIAALKNKPSLDFCVGFFEGTEFAIERFWPSQIRKLIIGTADTAPALSRELKKTFATFYMEKYTTKRIKDPSAYSNIKDFVQYVMYSFVVHILRTKKYNLKTVGEHKTSKDAILEFKEKVATLAEENPAYEDFTTAFADLLEKYAM